MYRATGSLRHILFKGFCASSSIFLSQRVLLASNICVWTWTHLGEAQMRPDHSHAGVAGQKIVPGLEVHNLLEVGLGGIVGVEKSPIVRAQHVLPPAVLGLGQGNLFLGNEAS